MDTVISESDTYMQLKWMSYRCYKVLILSVNVHDMAYCVV